MIRTPPGWGTDVISRAYHSITTAGPEWTETAGAAPHVRRIQVSDLGWALARGMEDFGAPRTDVIFLCVIYPLLKLLLAANCAFWRLCEAMGTVFRQGMKRGFGSRAAFRNRRGPQWVSSI